jgi:hypothetical protein
MTGMQRHVRTEGRVLGWRGGLPIGALAYTIDSQGVVLSAHETTGATPDPRAPASARATLPVLLCPLTWGPLQRLLAWGAHEGLTAAELLDTCRAGIPTPTQRIRSRQ